MLSKQNNFLKIVYKSLHRFCQIRGKDKSPFISLSVLRQAVEREHFYVRKHYEQIGNQLIYNINLNKWQIVRKMLSIININQLDSWLLLRRIAKAIHRTSNHINIQSISQQDIGQLLSVLALLHFQPKKAKNYYSFKGQKMEFDDSTPFINQLDKYINKISVSADNNQYFDLASKLLHTNPYLFVNKRDQFQSKILISLPELSKGQSLLNDLLTKGCISKFWTSNFKSEILKSNIPQIYKKPLKFEDLSIQTKTIKIKRQQKLQTQDQILNILQGYGYQVQQNIQINGYEIDFLISNKLIVEYNGHHHYIINSDHLIPSARDRWKQTILNKRQFALSLLPYTQWKVLKLFQEKRSYLVNKVEKDWLSYYKSRKENKK